MNLYIIRGKLFFFHYPPHLPASIIHLYTNTNNDHLTCPLKIVQTRLLNVSVDLSLLFTDIIVVFNVNKPKYTIYDLPQTSTVL